MDFGEYLRDLQDQEVSLAAQMDAQALLTELRPSTHLDRREETGESFIRALGKDVVDLTIMLPTRIKTYRLHRQLGLSTFQALRHSSPVEGLATAALIAPRQNHSR